MRAWLWRLGSFLVEWGRLVAWGNSLAGRIIRLVAFLAGLGTTQALTTPLHIFTWTADGARGRSYYWETTVGFVLFEFAMALLKAYDAGR